MRAARCEQDAKRSTDVQRANADPAAFDQVTVRHVVDGDTLAVLFADGERASVRLIGIDTPESVAPQKERNRPRRGRMGVRPHEGLWARATLWLQYDTNQVDKYGRPLAYVWRTLPASAAEADDPPSLRSMLNAIQVIDGYGQPKNLSSRHVSRRLVRPVGDRGRRGRARVTYVAGEVADVIVARCRKHCRPKRAVFAKKTVRFVARAGFFLSR